jgi:hypothetical protein
MLQLRSAVAFADRHFRLHPACLCLHAPAETGDLSALPRWTEAISVRVTLHDTFGTVTTSRPSPDHRSRVSCTFGQRTWLDTIALGHPSDLTMTMPNYHRHLLEVYAATHIQACARRLLQNKGHSKQVCCALSLLIICELALSPHTCGLRMLYHAPAGPRSNDSTARMAAARLAAETASRTQDTARLERPRPAPYICSTFSSHYDWVSFRVMQISFIVFGAQPCEI